MKRFSWALIAAGALVSACGARSEFDLGAGGATGAQGSGANNPTGPTGGVTGTTGTTTVSANSGETVGPGATTGNGPGSSVSGSSVTGTSGTGSSVSTSGAGGMTSSSVSTSGAGGGAANCLSCAFQNCPAAVQCLQSQPCLNGAACAVQNCLKNGMPDFGCALKCFNGDTQAALLAFNAVSCVANKCGMQCQGLFGGGAPPKP